MIFIECPSLHRLYLAIQNWMKNDSLISKRGKTLNEAIVIWHFSFKLNILVFELSVLESVDGVLETVEEVIADAQGHRVGHSEALEEVEIEVFFLLTLVIIVGIPLVDLDFVG
jgi:hypothetical protein